MKKSLMEQTDELDKLARQLMKMESKMRSGQWIDAWRDCRGIISVIEKAKRDLLQDVDDYNVEAR